jgi:hypothetical protein
MVCSVPILIADVLMDDYSTRMATKSAAEKFLLKEPLSAEQFKTTGIVLVS